MYACICNAITIPEIEKIVEDGHNSVEEVMLKCNAGGDCGACRMKVQKIITGTLCYLQEKNAAKAS